MLVAPDVRSTVARGFGDKWSLLIIRDMIFDGRRHYRELLSG
jgi:hypothetical protein